MDSIISMDRSVTKHAQDINAKVEEQLPNTRKKLNELPADPYTFFGRVDLVSAEKWQASKRKNPERASRGALLKIIEPGLKRGSSKYKRFERYLNQGEVLFDLFMRNGSQDAGLLLTVAPFLSVKDFEILWKHKSVQFVFELGWLSPMIREESQEYSAQATKMLLIDEDLSQKTPFCSLECSQNQSKSVPRQLALVEDHQTRRLWEIKEEEVALPSKIAEPFERWKADPSAFLRSDSSQVPLSLKEHYDYALSVRTSTISNEILWRFITTAYYDVISERSQSDRYSITKEAVAFAVAVICKSPSYDREAVQENIISWAKDGAKNRALANKLGGVGCYFYYPPNLSEWIWTKHLPQNAYDKAAKLLTDFGIFEKAQKSGAVDLGRSIEAILKAPFQSAVPAQSHGQWILPVSLQQMTNNAGDVEPPENISGSQKRKLAAEVLPRRRQRTETGTQRPSFPTAQSCQDLVASLSLASPQSTTGSHDTDLTPSTTPSHHPEDLPPIDHSPSWQHKLLNPLNEHFLLSFLCFSGGAQVGESVIFCATSPQKRWDGKGTVRKLTLRDTGLHLPYVSLFSDEFKLNQAIGACMISGTILQGKLQDGSSVYSLPNKMRSQNFCGNKELALQFLIHIAHIYPRDEALHPSFRNFGKVLLPQLKRCWDLLETPSLILPPPACDSLVESSLAASSLLRVSQVDSAIAAIVKAQHDRALSEHLNLAIAHRRSVVSRLLGNIDVSDILVRNSLKSTSIDDNRLHCLHGRLLFSLAENAILRKDFSKAVHYLNQWEVKDSKQVTPYEGQVLRFKNTVMGRLSRYQGDFTYAERCLNICLRGASSETSHYHHRRHLADVYCELQRAVEAEALVRFSVEGLQIDYKEHPKLFRRLLLPLAEACIQQNKFEEAATILLQFNKLFDGIPFQDTSDQLDHVRSIFGLLRIACHKSQWDEAHNRSIEAFNLMQRYQTFEPQSFYIGLSFLFRAIVLFELNRWQEGHKAFNSVRYYDSVPQHFITGLGTYVLRALISKMVSFGLRYP